jgi:Galactose oxidase, central domain
MVRASIVVSFLAILFSSAQAHANATLDAMGNNTWVKVDSGGLAAPNGILAYSGMAYDSVNKQLLVFGGGHCDYSGNEVWNFDTETLKWTEAYNGDPNPTTLTSSNFDNSNYKGAIFYPAGEPLANAAPLTRHTYDTVEFISSTGEMFVTGNYTYGSATEPTSGGTYACGSTTVLPYCWGCGDTWTFKPTTGLWTFRNVAKNPVPHGDGDAAAYDPVSGLMFVTSHESSGSDIWSYDVQNDLWTKLSPSGASPPYHIELVAEYDAKRQAIYRLGGESGSDSTSQLWRYDIKANSWTNLNPGGTPPPSLGGWGLAYDSVNDVLVAYRGGAGTYVYNPSSNTWLKPNPATDPGAPDRIHGDLKYDPVHNVTWLVKTGIETWAYRYHTGTPDTTPPKAPANLKVQ